MTYSGYQKEMQTEFWSNTQVVTFSLLGWFNRKIFKTVFLIIGNYMGGIYVRAIRKWQPESELSVECLAVWLGLHASAAWIFVNWKLVCSRVSSVCLIANWFPLTPAEEYVTCHTCRSPETILQKDTRLYFLQCETCHSRCSVASIKTGFQAVTGKRAQLRAKAN